MMVLPMEPLYCLMYLICFFNDTPTDLRNQLHTDLLPPGLCCRECVCHRLIQRANLHEKWETIMGGSHFLLPHRAQYNDNLLPQLIRPQNHRILLMDPVTAQSYPLVEVGSFTIQDPLFPGTVGDGYVYWGDAQKWLEERGYRVLKYTGPSPEVPLTVSTSASAPTSGAGKRHHAGWHARTRLHPAPGSNSQWDHRHRPQASTPRWSVPPASSEQISQPQNQKGTAGRLQQLRGNSLPYWVWKCIIRKPRPNSHLCTPIHLHTWQGNNQG